MQSISPGAVKTEFMARSDGRDDIEASKKEYDTMNPYGPVSIVRSYFVVLICLLLHYIGSHAAVHINRYCCYACIAPHSNMHL